MRSIFIVLLAMALPDEAQARRTFDATGHVKLFSIGIFPVPGDDLSGAALAASGSSVADSRLKLLWRPKRRVRVELHPTVTLTQGQTILGLNTGVARLDAELLPLTWSVVDDQQLQLKARLDRINLRWDVKRLRMTLGRQPISFGKGRVFTPLDLVAPFSPTTIDNSYKPGVDALRFDLFQGMSGRMTVVGAYLGDPGRDFDDWHMERATLVGHGKGSVGEHWELEGFAGWLYDEPVLGGSVFYNGGSVGVYGDLNVTLAEDEMLGRAVVGAQYKPTAKTYVLMEAYVQSVGATKPADYREQAEGPRYRRGELVQLGRVYAAVMGSYQLTPLVALGGAVLSNLEDRSVLLMPNLNWSVAENAALSLGFLGGFGARPSLELGPGGAPQMALQSEYGSAPFTFFLNGAFYF